MRRIFLDDAGGAPILPEVTAAVRDVPAGNPSSPHTEGRAARAALDSARDLAAQALGAARTEITFTSSGTEAVNLALFGAARRLPKSGRILTWAAEHQSVLAALRRLQAEGRPVEIAPVDNAARADPDAIPPDTALVSIGLANNEVGTIQPVRDIIDRAHQHGALVHVDACAGPRWIPIPAGANLVCDLTRGTCVPKPANMNPQCAKDCDCVSRSSVRVFASIVLSTMPIDSMS